MRDSISIGRRQSPRYCGQPADPVLSGTGYERLSGISSFRCCLDLPMTDKWTGCDTCQDSDNCADHFLLALEGTHRTRIGLCDVDLRVLYTVRFAGTPEDL